MSAQHAPHTPPLWRKFLSLPHSRLGWWAVVMASPVLALWVYGLVATLLSADAIEGEGVVMVVLFTGPLGILGALLGMGAVVYEHERSWLVWLAMVPVLTFVSLVVFWRLSSVLWLAVVPVLFLLSLVIYDTASGWLKMRSGKPG